jgi:hypothetical protein
VKGNIQTHLIYYTISLCPGSFIIHQNQEDTTTGSIMSSSPSNPMMRAENGI